MGARRERHGLHQLHLRHTARPKGVQITHRNIWVNAVTFGAARRRHRPRRLPAHAADVPRQRLGDALRDDRARRTQIVLRKVDGAEILRRVEEHGVTVMCAAPAVVAAVLEAAQTGRARSPAATGSGSSGRRAAADEDGRPRRGGAGLGVHPDLRAHRDLAAAHVQPVARRVGRPVRRGAGAKLVRAGAPALGVRLTIPRPRTTPARCSPGPTWCWRATGSSPRSPAGAGRRLVPHRRRRRHRRRRLPDDQRPQEGRDHHRR